MIAGRCVECGSLPVTKHGLAPLECARCWAPLCDGCALFNINGEPTALAGDEITDGERETYNAFCSEHDGSMPPRRGA